MTKQFNTVLLHSSRLILSSINKRDFSKNALDSISDDKSLIIAISLTCSAVKICNPCCPFIVMLLKLN